MRVWSSLHPSSLTWATRAELEAVADLILGDREPVNEQLSRLYDLRIAPFAAGLTSQAQLSSAAALSPSNPEWTIAAARYLSRLSAALHAVGFRPAEGSRPDSPGVYRDIPRGSDAVADHVWDKRLFIRPDPGQPSILHIRHARSPWARYTILFRDWLRHHPAERVRYELTKVALAQAHSADPDYDDYTRAKTVYFDSVQTQFERFGAGPGDRSSARYP